MHGNRFEISEIFDDTTATSGSIVDVLIPAHNSAKTLASVVKNVSAQQLPFGSKLRITICANACTDETVPVAKSVLNEVRTAYLIRTSLIITSEPGEPRALNIMLKVINNDIIIVVNDDVQPSEQSLKNLYSAMHRRNDLCAIGVPSRPLSRYCGPNQETPVLLANQISRLYAEKDITIVGRMYAFRKKIVKSFPDIISEDNYLTYLSLIKSGGYGILNDGQSYVYYVPPQTLEDVFGQTFMHSLSGIQFFRKYPDAFDLFVSIQQNMKNKRNSWHEAADKNILGLSKKLQKYCWELASYIDRTHPTVGSSRKRIASTLSGF